MRKWIVLVLVLIAASSCADTLSVLFSMSFISTLKKVSGQSITTEEGKTRISLGFDNGTATDSAEANAVYNVRGEVTSAAAVVYDLGSLSDALGNTVTFNRVKIFAFRNLDASDSVTIGSGSTPFAFDAATSSVLTVGPMGARVILCPYAGLDASVTNRIIYINTSGDLASYDLSIAGTE